MRGSCFARAALLAVCLSAPCAAVQAQRGSKEPPEKNDTIPSARIVVIPALERYDLSRLTRDAQRMTTIAVFTTDGPAARSLAVKAQAVTGGPLIPLERANRSIPDFTRALIDTIVERTARPNIHRGHRLETSHAAIVVVVEPELVLPFVRGSLTERGRALLDRSNEGLATYTVFVRADRMDLISATPVRPE